MRIRVDTESADDLTSGDGATVRPPGGGRGSGLSPDNGGQAPPLDLLKRAPVAAAGFVRAENTVEPEMQEMEKGERIVLGIALFVLPLLLLVQIVAVWPSAIAATAGQAQPRVPWLLGLAHSTMTTEETLFVLVALVGALASLSASSFLFATHAGRGELSSRWTWSYLLRPMQGATLAVVVYFVLRAGLLGNSSVKAQDPYGIAAIAALVGLFSPQALQKLKDVFNTLWGVDDQDSSVVTGRDSASAEVGKTSAGAGPTGTSSAVGATVLDGGAAGTKGPGGGTPGK